MSYCSWVREDQARGSAGSAEHKANRSKALPGYLLPCFAHQMLKLFRYGPSGHQTNVVQGVTKHALADIAAECASWAEQT